VNAARTGLRRPRRAPRPAARRCLAALALAALSAPCGAAGPAIQVNQIGYLPGAAKWAAMPPTTVATFTVRDAASGREVFRGHLGPSVAWAPAADAVRLADFSALTRPGVYRLHVDGMPDSPRFVVAADAYVALEAGAIRAYYFNRAGIALDRRHAGPYARPAGHPDTRVRVHASAAGASRPEGSTISSPGGWYDACDYNKYVVNSGISVYELLAAYEHFPRFFDALSVGLPESGNGAPDLLDEVHWNLAWMLTMQDPADGGVHHKLTNKGFDGIVMPHAATSERYVVGKSTAATLDFAAAMAMASRVYAPYDRVWPGLSRRMLEAAQSAWKWAQAHPAEVYREPPDIHTGVYGDSHLDDEFAWAAAELYIATHDDAYWTAMHAERTPAVVPGWNDVGALAWISLAQHRAELTPIADRALIENRIRSLAGELLADWQASPYRLSMRDGDFAWGSNAVALNRALFMIQAWRLDGDRRLLDAAQSALDYVLGRNPLGMAMVTGFGTRSPRHPHHRPSMARGDRGPVPGFLVGGPNPGQQDARGCRLRYASSAPALSYLDADCAFASNEVAINWNAPLVYVTAALATLTPPAR
jgi:endoglucanase